MNQKDFMMFVPYLDSTIKIKGTCFQTIKYSVILQKNLSMLHNTKKEGFNKELQLWEKGNFELVQCVDERPIRFVIMNNDEFKVLYDKTHKCLYNVEEQLKEGIIEDPWRKPCCILRKIQIGQKN